MAAAVTGLRASYHRLLDRIELMLPPRFRPFYNHPAGNDGGREAGGLNAVGSCLGRVPLSERSVLPGEPSAGSELRSREACHRGETSGSAVCHANRPRGAVAERAISRSVP